MSPHELIKINFGLSFDEEDFENIQYHNYKGLSS